MEDEILSPNEGQETVVESQETATPSETVVETGATGSTPAESKPVQSKEENAAFAEMRRKAEAAETSRNQIEKDYKIAKEFGAEYGVYSEADIPNVYGHLGITNLTQLKEAIRQKQMEDAGIDVDTVSKYVDEHPDVKWAREQKQQQEQQKFVDKNKIDFLDWFREENGRDYDTKTDQIPEHVWAASQLYESSGGKEGKSLVDAYALHEVKQLKAKNKAQEVNQSNAASSVGSVTGNGTAKDTPLTEEMINNMSDKERISRWQEVKKVMGMK